MRGSNSSTVKSPSSISSHLGCAHGNLQAIANRLNSDLAAGQPREFYLVIHRQGEPEDLIYACAPVVEDEGFAPFAGIRGSVAGAFRLVFLPGGQSI